MVRRLRACTALAGDPNSISSIHIWVLTLLSITSSGGSNISLETETECAIIWRNFLFHRLLDLMFKAKAHASAGSFLATLSPGRG